MSDLDDFLKAVSEAKQQSPVAQKVKEVKTNIKEDLGDLFSQLSVIKEQDPVQQKHKKIEKQVQESVKMDLGDLFSQLSSLKNDLEEELVVAEAKLVEVKQEEMLTEVTPIPAMPEIRTPKQRIKDTNADVDKYLTGKSFQQPDPDLVSKDVEAIRTKIKFLEQAIGRIAATGSGGGEVNLRFLDDVDRSSIADGKFLRYNSTKNKFEFASVFEESTIINGTANQIVSTTVGNTTTLSLPNSITTPGDLTVTGDLTVNGTTTTVNSVTLTVDDNNIELGSITGANDTTATGGGITLKGTTNKTISWSSLGWTSSEDFNLVTGKAYEINGTSVLNSTTLGSGVVSSSLTSVGTIATGVWQGTVINPTYGGTGTSTALTAGSVVFAGASGVYSQDNANLFWDDTNNRLGIGTSSPSQSLHIRGAGTRVQIESTGGGNPVLQFKLGSNEMFWFFDGTNGYLRTDNAARHILLQAGGTQGNVGIGTESPQSKLDVTGAINASADSTFNSVTVGRGPGNVDTNTVVGYQALNGNTTGTSNVALGYQAALVNTTGADNMAIGKLTLRNNSTGSSNVAVGNAALYNNTGSSNVAIGTSALNSGAAISNNTAIGHEALKANTAGSSVAIGYQAFVANTSGGANTGLGNSVTTQAITDTNSIVIGSSAVGIGSNTTVIGNSSTTKTKLFGTLEATGDATINSVTVGRGNINLLANTAVGVNALSGTLMSTATNQNVAVGSYTLSNLISTATLINYAGDNPGVNLFTGEVISNVQLTYSSTYGGPQVEAGGTYPRVDLVIYDDDGFYYLGQTVIVDGGSKFTAAGTYLEANVTSPLGQTIRFVFNVAGISAGANNTAIGYNAGTVATVGTNCVYIGQNANPNSSTLPPRTNEIVIGAGAQGDGTNTARIGNSSTTLYTANLNTNSITATSISVSNSFSASSTDFSTSANAIFNLRSTSTGTSSIASFQTSGILNIGGSSSSTSAGTITLGRATGTSTVNIGTGIPAASRTKTINIGTSATTAAGTTLINIGAIANTTTTLNGANVTLAALGTASAGATRFNSPQLNLQLSKHISGVTYTSGLRISASCAADGTETYLFDSNYGEVSSPDRGSLVRFNFPNTYLQVLNRNDAMGIQYGATYGAGYMGLVSTGATFPSGANTSRYLYGMHAGTFAQGSIIPTAGNSPNFRNILDNGSGNLICGSLNTGLGGTSTISATNFLQINHTTPSTSTTTGALQVAGGVGIAGALNVGGDITVKSGSTTGSATITTPTTELVLSQTGDTFGTSSLRLQNRNNANGAIFETVGLGLVDFIFKTDASNQRNIRYETRGGLNQFEIGLPAGSYTLGVADTFAKITKTTASTSTTTGALQVAGGAGIAGNLNVGGDVLVRGTGGVGYGVGSGGTVTQLTSRNTAVTLNKMSGSIVIFSQNNAAEVEFDFNNSFIGLNDTVICNLVYSEATLGVQNWIPTIRIRAAGIARVYIANWYGNPLTNMTLNFTIIKGSTS